MVEEPQMKLAALLALAVLTGCATTSEIVKVPVPVECRVAVPNRPAMPTESLGDHSTLDDIVRAALAELELREGYELELRAALATCTNIVVHTSVLGIRG